MISLTNTSQMLRFGCKFTLFYNKTNKNARKSKFLQNILSKMLFLPSDGRLVV